MSKPTLQSVLKAQGFNPQDAKTVAQLAKEASEVKVNKNGVTLKITI